MKLKETLKQLESLGSEKVRAQNIRHGAGIHQFGIRLGEIRKLAKKIKVNHELALELWETGNVDARFLAILLIEPKTLTSAELNRMVRSVTFVNVADWLTSYVVKHHSDKEALRGKWMKAKDPMAARAGWAQTTARVARTPEGIDQVALLDRIEAEMGKAAPEAQWTMNFCLIEIGVNTPKLRKRALAIGEKLGAFRDYPTSKGCTSPFAPLAINEMVRRQG